MSDLNYIMSMIWASVSLRSNFSILFLNLSNFIWVQSIMSLRNDSNKLQEIRIVLSLFFCCSVRESSCSRILQLLTIEFKGFLISWEIVALMMS